MLSFLLILIFLDSSSFLLVIYSFLGCHGIFPIYQRLSSFTGFYVSLPGQRDFTRFLRKKNEEKEFYEALSGFTGFYWVFSDGPMTAPDQPVEVYEDAVTGDCLTTLHVNRLPHYQVKILEK